MRKHVQQIFPGHISVEKFYDIASFRWETLPFFKNDSHFFREENLLGRGVEGGGSYSLTETIFMVITSVTILNLRSGPL